jgi:TPR repeat protein
MSKVTNTAAVDDAIKLMDEALEEFDGMMKELDAPIEKESAETIETANAASTLGGDPGGSTSTAALEAELEAHGLSAEEAAFVLSYSFTEGKTFADNLAEYKTEVKRRGFRAEKVDAAMEARMKAAIEAATPEDLVRRATGGCGKSAYELATCYIRGYNGFEKDYVKSEHWLRKAATNGEKHAIECLKLLRNQKSKGLNAVAEASGLVLSSEAKVAFVLGPLPEHRPAARTFPHHLALCFLHGVCGLEKSVRLAKDVLKLSLTETNVDDDTIAAQKALLKQIRRCPGCGKYAYWTCKLCRGVRYCSRGCQKWHWKHGDGEPHKVHCPRAVTTIPEGTITMDW